MKFVIAGLGIGRGSAKISEDEFTRTKQAKRSLVVAMSIEGKFDLLLENYAEFERGLLELALHQMIFSDLDWSSMQFDTQKVNRTLTNLLSASRLYIDQLKHEAGALDTSTPSLARVLKDKGSAEYDSKLGYRVMEASRNYTQHRDLPVQQLKLPNGVGAERLIYEPRLPCLARPRSGQTSRGPAD
jgi:hypothetical protein